MLMLSKELQYPGYLQQSETTGYPLSYLAGQLGVSTSQLKVLLDKFKEAEMIEVNGNGCICIPNWGKYQATYDYRQSKPVESIADDILDEQLRENVLVYEAEIGVISPSVKDDLIYITDNFKAGWLTDAIIEAKQYNRHRNIKYLLTIMERWKAEGKTGKSPGKKQVTDDDSDLIEQ